MRPRADPAAGDGSYDPTSDPRHDPAAPVTARRGGLVLPRVPWTAHGSTMAVRSPGIGPAFGPVERKSPEIGQRRGFASRPGRSRPAVTAPARCEPPSAPHHRRPAPPRPNHPASRSTRAKQLTIAKRHHRHARRVERPRPLPTHRVGQPRCSQTCTHVVQGWPGPSPVPAELVPSATTGTVRPVRRSRRRGVEMRQG